MTVEDWTWPVPRRRTRAEKREAREEQRRGELQMEDALAELERRNPSTTVCESCGRPTCWLGSNVSRAPVRDYPQPWEHTRVRLTFSRDGRDWEWRAHPQPWQHLAAAIELEIEGGRGIYLGVHCARVHAVLRNAKDGRALAKVHYPEAHDFPHQHLLARAFAGIRTSTTTGDDDGDG